MTILRPRLSPRSTRHLLLLSYHFPPAETPGALRWEKLSAQVADRGFSLDVVTRSPTEPAADGGRLDRLPAGVQVLGVPESPTVLDRVETGAWRAFRRKNKAQRPEATPSPARTPVRTARPSSLPPEEMSWTRRPRDLLRHFWSWQLWHREAVWARRAVRCVATDELEPLTAVITCGPPHPVHLFGGRLAQTLVCPHIMDMRDPWSLPRRLPEHLASPLSFRLACGAERRAVRGAALVVANTDPLRDALRSAYPARHEAIITVMNGYDEDDPLPSTTETPGRSAPFRIVYAGSVYLDRSPATLFQAARRVATTLGLTPADLQLEFIGPGEAGEATVLGEAERAGIPDFVRVFPRCPRSEALNHLARGTMLLNLAQDSAYAIPSKVFEYLRFPAWILALAEPGSPTDQVLAGTDVDRAAPGDIEGISRILEHRIRTFRDGGHPGFVRGRERLSRSHQAGILLDHLDQLSTSAPRA